LVSKDRVHQKKHSSTHRSLQTGICQTEEGIVSLNEKSEWNHLRRNSNPAVRGHSDLIGGIDTQEHFQTTSQRQMNGVKTSQDQLTLVKRAGHRKPIQDPAQATPEIRYGQSSMVAGGSGSGSGGYGGGEYGGGGGYGYRPQAIGGSLIKNIGSSLASRVEPLPSHSSGSSHGSGSTSKTLVVENFNSTPGMLSIFGFFVSPVRRIHWSQEDRLRGRYLPLSPLSVWSRDRTGGETGREGS
jgi:hypothetical protein